MRAKTARMVRMIRKVLVTGGHGFLGAAFVARLREKNIPYATFDRVQPHIPADVDCVVHFAGLTPMSDIGRPITPEDYERVNVEGTEKLLNLLRAHTGLKRFINIGSAAEYGISRRPITESTKPDPQSPYGKSKLTQTKLVEAFAKESDAKIMTLRLFNIIGLSKIQSLPPERRRSNIFVNLTEQFVNNFSGTITVSHERDIRDYIDLDEAMEAVIAALTTEKGGRYELINVCSGRATTLKELVSVFGDYFNVEYTLKRQSAAPTKSVGDPTKAKRLLGWSAKMPLAESIQKLFASKKRVLIIGAGVAGHDIVSEIRRENRDDIIVIGFVDDDKKKQGSRVNGIKVIGAIKDLPRLIKKTQADQVLVSTPSVGKEVVKRVSDLVPPGFPIKVLPSISSVLLGKVDLSYVRDVDVSDLIGRPLIKSDQQFISSKNKGKTFLVTGGAGSIGSEIVRQLWSSQAKRIIVVDSWEEGIFNLSEELQASNGLPHPDIQMYLGNVRDKERMEEIIKKWEPDGIFHAAAYKHVHLLEQNESEAHKTNYLGTKNLLDLAVKYHVKEFVLISTDKAVNPKSILGKTKRAAELLIKAYAKKYPKTRFCAVRFGNVLHSSGSAIPKFLRQIRNRAPITITHKEMMRYFMSIPEAVSLVLLSSIVAKNGNILILDMGEPVKILDLAIHLIKMHGLEPYTDIPIVEIGIRPGEKLYEELSYDKSVIKPSRVPRIFIAEEL